MAFFLRRVQSHAEAEDLTQEVFARLLVGKGTTDQPDVYVFRIAQNLLVDRVRMSGKQRELTLVRGRAKFDVAKDPLRPFTVVAGDKIVVATGTSFSVEMVGKDVRVLLYHGRVSVLDRGAKAGAGKELQLNPGDEMIAPSRFLSPVRRRQVAEWRTSRKRPIARKRGGSMATFVGSPMPHMLAIRLALLG
jgi:hypothetical protein